MRIRSLAALCSAVAAACSSDPAAVSPDVRLTATTFWSGNDVQLVSAGFTGLATLPDVVVGTAVIATRRMDDSTLVATLPDTGGTLALAIRIAGTDQPVGTIQVRGFAGWKDGPLLTGVTSPYPGTAEPEVMGYSGRDIVRANLRTGNITQLLPRDGWPSDCLWGPGVSAVLDGAIVAPDSACRLRLWQMTPTPQIADSGPTGATNLGAVQLANGLWATGAGDYVRVSQRQPNNTFTSLSLTYFSDFVTVWAISPKHDRVFPTGGGVRLNESVFALDAATGQVAYHIPPWRETSAATFSPGGDTAFLLVNDQSFIGHVASVRSSDGQPFAATPALEPGNAELLDILADPSRPYLYAATYAYADSNVTIRVLDRATLQVIAKLRPPRAGYPNPANGYGWWNLVLDASHQELLLYYHRDFVGLGQYFAPRPNNAFTLRFSLN